MLTPAEWVALIGAIAGAFVAVVKAASDAAKTRAEVAAMRADMEAARVLDTERRTKNDRMLAEAHHELTPNTGGSIKDAVTRFEHALVVLDTRLEGYEQALERVENHQRDTAADVRGLRRDIGRLHDNQIALTNDVAAKRAEIHERIQGLQQRNPDS